MTAADELALEHLTTGIPGLDTILRGGLLRGGVYMIQGTPGAGKTIFANQACFHHVTSGGRAVYVTLLAESHSRMLQHLQSMQFFREDVIPKSLYYVSAFRMLEEQGLNGVVDLLRREVKGQKATLLVLDGLVAAEETAKSDREFKRFIHEIQSHAAANGCTVLLLTSGVKQIVHAEHTMVDGLIELEDQLFSQRTERALRVRKFRGSDFLPGRHPFRISDRGIVLWPRVEAQYAKASRPENPRKVCLPSGVADLDAMLGGGLSESSSTVIFGASGTGKTTLGLEFVCQSTSAEPGLYLSFFESPQRLMEKAAGIGLPLRKLVENKAVQVMWEPQGERIIDELAYEVLDAVQAGNIKRLVIDGLNAFTASALYPDRISRFFSCLSNELRARRVTSLHTGETRDLVGGSLRMPIDGISALVDNLIVLRYVEHEARLSRVISVLKVRDNDFDHRLRELLIGPAGTRIGSQIGGLHGMLSGSTRPSAPQSPDENSADRGVSP